MKDIDKEKIKELWDYLPSDYRARVSKQFSCSEGMATYVRDTSLKDVKLRKSSKNIRDFLIKLAVKERDIEQKEQEELNKLINGE